MSSARLALGNVTGPGQPTLGDNGPLGPRLLAPQPPASGPRHDVPCGSRPLSHDLTVPHRPPCPRLPSYWGPAPQGVEVGDFGARTPSVTGRGLLPRPRALFGASRQCSARPPPCPAWALPSTPVPRKMGAVSGAQGPVPLGTTGRSRNGRAQQQLCGRCVFFPSPPGDRAAGIHK